MFETGASFNFSNKFMIFVKMNSSLQGPMAAANFN